MATHDYVIDNSTGANVRTDINNVLQAILTNNSSSSAPSTTAAYMWWADTSNGILKIRNSANSAWVELFQLDGTLTLEDGTKTAPALAHRSNLNTGIFFSAANKFNVSTAGVERLELGTTTIFNEEGADVDFRIEGDDEQNLFYVDASVDKIAIGSNAPSARLSVLDDTAFTAFASAVPNSTDCMLQVSSNPSSEAVNRHATIQFGVNGGTHNRVASISSVAESASNRKMGLVFCTDSGSNRNERMRLTGDGQLGIGTSGPSRMLHIKSDGVNKSHIALIDVSTTNEVFRVGQQSDGDGFLQLLNDSAEAKVALEATGDSYFLGGNLGIGTSTPQALLDISGPTTSMRLSQSATNYFEIARSSSDGHYRITTEETGSAIIFKTDNDGTGALNRFIIDRKGNIKIGEFNSLDVAMSLVGDGNGLLISRSDSGAIICFYFYRRSIL